MNFTPEESNVKKSYDTAAQEIQAKNSDALDRESLSTCNGEEIATPSDHSSSSLTDHDLHSTSSEPVFRSHELPRMRNRPRAKSAPNIMEQRVALFLRSVSDYINNSYGNNLPVKTTITYYFCFMVKVDPYLNFWLLRGNLSSLDFQILVDLWPDWPKVVFLVIIQYNTTGLTGSSEVQLHASAAQMQ